MNYISSWDGYILCEGNLPITGEFPPTQAINTELFSLICTWINRWATIVRLVIWDAIVTSLYWWMYQWGIDLKDMIKTTHIKPQQNLTKHRPCVKFIGHTLRNIVHKFACPSRYITRYLLPECQVDENVIRILAVVIMCKFGANHRER